MIGIAKMTIAGVKKSPAAMAGRVYEQRPGLLPRLQVDTMVDLSADVIESARPDCSGVQLVEVMAITKTSLLIGAGQDQ